MEYVKSYRDLEVYKLSQQLSGEIVRIIKLFQIEEMYLLTYKVLRSSRSKEVHIAEEWKKRKNAKQFISKLKDAKNKQQKSQYWIETIVDFSYLTKKIAVNLLIIYYSAGKKLNYMISKAEDFCHRPDNLIPTTDFLIK